MITLQNLIFDLQIVWICTSWAEDEETKVKVFESIEDINYETDDFVITSLNHEPHPVITDFFTRKENVLKIYPSDMFTINRQAALSTELRLNAQIEFGSTELNLMRVHFSPVCQRTFTLKAWRLPMLQQSMSIGLII